MKNFFLGSGEKVVDRYQSHLHPEVMAILPEALAKIKSKGRNFLIEEIDFGRIVGESICVATRPGDQIVFVRRSRRFGMTRFVKNRLPEPSSKAVVILKTADGEPGAYVLITAFIGDLSEPEPWDRNATSQSRDFWNTHALVWGSEEVILETETTQCPW